MQVDGNVDVGGVAPEIVPDRVCVGVGDGGAGSGVLAGEDAVEVGEEAVVGGREEVSVVVLVVVRVGGGEADDGAVEIAGGDG